MASVSSFVPRHLRDLYRVARRKGWTVTTTGGGHLKWRPQGDGEVIVTASTPSGPRHLANEKARFKRAGLAA